MSIIDFLSQFAQTLFEIAGGSLALGFYIGYKVGHGDFDPPKAARKRKK